MSTDTAFVLGMLALVGPRFPDRLRASMLTVTVVDDIVALVVIALVYTEHLRWMPLLIGTRTIRVHARDSSHSAAEPHAVVRGIRCRDLARALQVRRRSGRRWSRARPPYLCLFSEPADPRPATEGFRLSGTANSTASPPARASVDAAISPNDRLQHGPLRGPLTSSSRCSRSPTPGIPISRHFLSTAYKSPITLGIVVGYVLGKPRYRGRSWLVTAVTATAVAAPVGWAAVAGAGTIVGIGFTVSLLIASLAFTGTHLRRPRPAC